MSVGVRVWPNPTTVADRYPETGGGAIIGHIPSHFDYVHLDVAWDTGSRSIGYSNKLLCIGRFPTVSEFAGAIHRSTCWSESGPASDLAWAPSTSA